MNTAFKIPVARENTYCHQITLQENTSHSKNLQLLSDWNNLEYALLSVNSASKKNKPVQLLC